MKLIEYGGGYYDSSHLFIGSHNYLAFFITLHNYSYRYAFIIFHRFILNGS